MKRILHKLLIGLLVFAFTFAFAFCTLIAGSLTVFAAETPMITDADELAAALAKAKDGDTILVGDITFKPMPGGMIAVEKSVTIKSGKNSNAVFSGCMLMVKGSMTDETPPERKL